jgi:polar amino acid transport system substrate-binding protein
MTLNKIVCLIATFFAISTSSIAQQTSDPRIADIQRAGELRVGIGLGVLMQAIKNPATGELRGAALELAKSLATRMGVKLVLVEYPRPGAVMEGLRTKAWDVAFLVFDPERASVVDFSNIFLQSDLTYLTGPGSKIRSSADADQAGVRIATPRGDGSDLFLTRMLKHAELIRTEGHAAAVDLVRNGGADGKASPRFVLATELPSVPGGKILEGGFNVISYAAIVPKGQAARLAYINEFVEDAKTSGLVARTIDSLGLQGVRVMAAEKGDRK